MPEAPHNLTLPKTVAIISKPDRPELSEVLPALEKWLRARQYTVIMDDESAAYYSAAQVVSRDDLGKLAPVLALVLGGDGTLLSAARAVSSSGTLILGINLGTLGFLTEVQLSGLYPALEAIAQGQRLGSAVFNICGYGNANYDDQNKCRDDELRGCEAVVHSVELKLH